MSEFCKQVGRPASRRDTAHCRTASAARSLGIGQPQAPPSRAGLSSPGEIVSQLGTCRPALRPPLGRVEAWRRCSVGPAYLLLLWVDENPMTFSNQQVVPGPWRVLKKTRTAARREQTNWCHSTARTRRRVCSCTQVEVSIGRSDYLLHRRIRVRHLLGIGSRHTTGRIRFFCSTA